MLFLATRNFFTEKMLARLTPIRVRHTYLLENQIEFLVVLEEFDQLQDAWMSLAVVERLHLPKDSGSRVTRNLVNYFHSVFQVCVNIYTSLNRGVRTLAQNISGQLVQLCKCKKRKQNEIFES